MKLTPIFPFIDLRMMVTAQQDEIVIAVTLAT
jgi:hypothetical protein